MSLKLGMSQLQISHVLSKLQVFAIPMQLESLDWKAWPHGDPLHHLQLSQGHQAGRLKHDVDADSSSYCSLIAVGATRVLLYSAVDAPGSRA